MNHPKLTSYLHRMEHSTPWFTTELLADTHQLFPYSNKQLKTALDDMRTRDVQHVFFVGDLSNNGMKFQFQAFFSLLDQYPFDYQFALGNHDTFHRFHETTLRIPEALATHVYHKQVYHKTCYEHISVYVLNSQKPQEDNIYFEQNQLAWLQAELSKDQKPWKLILCHNPLADTHPNSEDRSMHIGFQNAKLRSILRKHKGIVFASGHLHNSYSLSSMCMLEDIVCINVPGFSKVDYGIQTTGIGVSLSVYPDFLVMQFYKYNTHEKMDHIIYVYDQNKNQVISSYAE